ncbi:MAG: exodeoxyribonuclease VII small subunit [Candidatus Omnitrophica bacterium]|nr:exodeoxyribonuclease VII small subunit [Candidatus Omnitrophota bacterium]
MTEPELKFEKALERLEKIVEDLESGNLPLEDALKKYEEGVKLSRLCTQKLTCAESKIELLTRTLNGTLESAPLDSEAAAKKIEKKKTKKAQTGGDSSGNDLLL